MDSQKVHLQTLPHLSPHRMTVFVDEFVVDDVVVFVVVVVVVGLGRLELHFLLN